MDWQTYLVMFVIAGVLTIGAMAWGGEFVKPSSATSARMNWRVAGWAAAIAIFGWVVIFADDPPHPKQTQTGHFTPRGVGARDSIDAPPGVWSEPVFFNLRKGGGWTVQGGCLELAFEDEFDEGKILKVCEGRPKPRIETYRTSYFRVRSLDPQSVRLIWWPN